MKESVQAFGLGLQDYTEIPFYELHHIRTLNRTGRSGFRVRVFLNKGVYNVRVPELLGSFKGILLF